MEETIKEDMIFKYRDRYAWECFSKKAMKKKYPEGGYKVLGEVIKKEGNNKEFPIRKGEGKQPLYVQPLKTYNKIFYHRYAYIYSQEHDGYIIVKKNNWLFWLLGLLVTMILIGLLAWGLSVFGNRPNIDPNAKDYETSFKRPENFDDSKILIPGYNNWNMKAGTDEVFVALMNPKDNPCYFQFDVVLDETNETLFSTKLVPPGQAITQIKLPRKFAKGIYPITVKINSYDLEDTEKSLNGGEVKTNIVAIEGEKK